MSRMNKKRVFAVLMKKVQADLQAAVESQKSTHEGAVHEEARPENDKDTRALESSYLALGLQKRVAELQDTLEGLEGMAPQDFEEADPISVSALVTIEDETEQTAHYLLAPNGGGMRIEVDGSSICVVTPRSPLGRALLGKCCGDPLTIRTPNGEKEAAIITVC